jgi:hypothetical protein
VRLGSSPASRRPHAKGAPATLEAFATDHASRREHRTFTDEARARPSRHDGWQRSTPRRPSRRAARSAWALTPPVYRRSTSAATLRARACRPQEHRRDGSAHWPAPRSMANRSPAFRRRLPDRGNQRLTPCAVGRTPAATDARGAVASCARGESRRAHLRRLPCSPPPRHTPR